MENSGNSDKFFFGGVALKSAMKLQDTCSLEENYDQARQHIQKQRHYFADKGQSSQSYGFSSSHVWM